MRANALRSLNPASLWETRLSDCEIFAALCKTRVGVSITPNWEYGTWLAVGNVMFALCVAFQVKPGETMLLHCLGVTKCTEKIDFDVSYLHLAMKGCKAERNHARDVTKGQSIFFSLSLLATIFLSWSHEDWLPVSSNNKIQWAQSLLWHQIEHNFDRQPCYSPILPTSTIPAKQAM